jgi:predicted dehydrogenase
MSSAAFCWNTRAAKLAQLTTAIRTVIPPQAAVYGSKGSLFLPQFTGAQHATITYHDGSERKLDFPFEINGFEYQIREAMACLAAGKQHSDILTPAQSVAVMRTMDEVRAIWGMKFPFEV